MHRSAPVRIIRQTGWAGLSACVSAVVIAAGMSFVTPPAQAAYQLPEGERITHLPVVARAIPNKEAYELYDPKIGKNFDVNKFWLRADLRVRQEMRNGSCFGSAMKSLLLGVGSPATTDRNPPG